MFDDLVTGLAIVAAVLTVLAALNWAMARFIERLVPPIGRVVAVDGVRLHIVDSNPGAAARHPPLVFIHGLLAQLNHFDYALARRFPERRVVLIDRPGCGFSQPCDDFTFAGQAALIERALDQLGVVRPVLVGHSLGGAVAAALALKSREKFAALALIAPLTQLIAAPPPAFSWLFKRSRLFIAIGAWTLGPILTLLRAEDTRDKVFAPDAMPTDFWSRGGGLLGLRPGALLTAAGDIVTQPHDLPRMLLRYGGLELPIGVLFGAQDKVLDPDFQGREFCEQAADAEFELIPGGHMLPVAAPEACEKFIRRVLARAEQLGERQC